MWKGFVKQIGLNGEQKSAGLREIDRYFIFHNNKAIIRNYNNTVDSYQKE